jgi:hypothetical protein
MGPTIHTDEFMEHVRPDEVLSPYTPLKQGGIRTLPPVGMPELAYFTDLGDR